MNQQCSIIIIIKNEGTHKCSNIELIVNIEPNLP